MSKKSKKAASRKSCIVKSGPKKGKLKKGYRFSKRGGCVKARKSK